MKILSKSSVTESLQQLSNVTTQLIDTIDDHIKAGYQSISPYLLSPQWSAAYNGLKKLVEKDYSDDDNTIAGSVLSS